MKTLIRVPGHPHRDIDHGPVDLTGRSRRSLSGLPVGHMTPIGDVGGLDPKRAERKAQIRRSRR